MAPASISRQTLKQKLVAWASGIIAATELHKWVTDLQLDGPPEFEDWESKDSGQFSVSKEVLAELEMLDINFVTVDDIPTFIEFLDTPVSGFEDAYITFIGRLQSIDTAKRMKALKHTEPYARHCV
jgi:hypothetical protein